MYQSQFTDHTQVTASEKGRKFNPLEDERVNGRDGGEREG